jgi:hypothetical protein
MSRDKLSAHAKRIEGLLAILLPDPVDVVFNNNRSTMVSHRKKAGRLVVRLHRMFALAGLEDVKSLAGFISGSNPSEARKVDGFIASHKHEIERSASSARKRPVCANGMHHDLCDNLDRVVERYFGGIGEVKIGWGRETTKRRSRRSRSRSRVLAKYSYEDRTISVNPVLDSDKVPGYVLDWIVYHEMLHHVLPVEKTGERTRFHTRSFKALERGFDRYKEAVEWEKANLEWLLK